MNYGVRSRFSKYISLNTPRERVIHECANTEFKEVMVKYPYVVKESTHIEKIEYCRF